MSELKPCPFCGGEAKYYSDDLDFDHHEVACSNTDCTYLISKKKTKETAYSAWNQRQDDWISVDSLKCDVLVMYNARKIIKAKRLMSNGRLYMELYGTGMGTARDRCREIGLCPDSNETSYEKAVKYIDENNLQPPTT